MAENEKKLSLNELLEQGKRRGKLTTKEINEVMEEISDLEQLDKFYDTVENYNIKNHR